MSSELSEVFGEVTTPVTDSTDKAVPADAPPTGDAPPKEDDKIPPKSDDKVEPPAPPVDWEKRFKDTQRFTKETREENKRLRADLDASKQQADRMIKLMKKHDKELFPNADEPDLEPAAPKEDKEWQDKVRASEELTRTVKVDYDEKVGKGGDDTPFTQAVAADPTLWNRVRASVNPALEAYKIAEEFLTKKKYGETPEEIRAKLREELLAEQAAEKVAAEKKLKEEGEKKKKDSINTQTLRDVQTGSPLNNAGGTELRELFGGR